MLTSKFNFETPGNCYHVKCREMAGWVYYYVSKVPTVFNTTAALFMGTIEPPFKIHLGHKLLLHAIVKNLKWGLCQNQRQNY